MKKKWILIATAGAFSLLLLLWLLLTSGGEALLVFSPPHATLFTVKWRLRLTSTLASPFLERQNEHSQNAEAELLIEREKDASRLHFTILHANRTGTVFSEIKNGDKFSLLVDKNGALKQIEGEPHQPPRAFFLLPLLNAKHTKAGEEWCAKWLVENIPYLSGEQILIKMTLNSASSKTAFLKGTLLEPKIVKISLLDMKITETTIKLDFDKEKLFIKRLYASISLEALSGAQTIHFECEFLCSPVQ